MIVARINDDAISAEVFVRLLKLGGQLDALLENVLIDKLLFHAAKTANIQISPVEVQERVDLFRRVQGLHRAKDTIDYLDNISMTTDELEAYIIEMLYREKMRESIVGKDAIDSFFKKNYPAFERVVLNHITLDSETKAQEIFAILEEEPESFADLAEQHSLSKDTREQGGYLGKVSRGVLPNEVEAKIYNAQPGSILGPFVMEVDKQIEIFQLMEKQTPKLDEKTVSEIKQKLFRQWLSEQIDSNAYILELL
ncbi:MAG: peptidylprolyl isomerase [Methylococcales bacterium]